MRITRRAFNRTLAGAAVAVPTALSAANSVVQGVRVGAQSYSFRDLLFNGKGDPIDELISALTAAGLYECDLMQSHTEPRSFLNGYSPTRITADGKVSESSLYGEVRGVVPPPNPAATAEQRKWRLEVSLDHYRNIRKKFEAAGIRLTGFNATFGTQWWADQTGVSEADLDRPFEVAKALGADMITVSTTLSMAKRFAPIVDKHKIIVAVHNHAKRDDPDQFASPESFEAALRLSRYYRINLDIGHLTAANYDAMDFLAKRHREITLVHLKDRKRNNGMNMPWGQGDTPIQAFLREVKTRKYDIPVMIEWEYQGSGKSSIEVPKCFNYVKAALA